MCGRSVPWKWVPAVLVDGKPLAGTGVWQSQVEDGRCVDCEAELQARRRRAQQALVFRAKLTELFGGTKPYREFLFDNYKVTPGNQNAFECCKRFNPATECLYLWGSCGAGKTHLAFAAARRCVEAALSVALLSPYRLGLQTRTNDAELEKAAINEWVSVNVLILDHLEPDLDVSSRQLLQEILDRRDFEGRTGLMVTSVHSPQALAEKMGHDAIASRLAGMCDVVKVEGPDFRINLRQPRVA